MTSFRARYCLSCGGPLTHKPTGGSARPACESCGFELYQNPVGASAGLVLREGQVLLVQRGIEPFKGAWAIPAGYQDAGESPSEAAEREIREETGISVEAYMLLDLLFVPDDPRKPANVALFACRSLGGTLQGADDALDARWYALDNLPDEIAFNNREQVFERLLPGRDLRMRLDLLGGNADHWGVD